MMQYNMIYCVEMRIQMPRQNRPCGVQLLVVSFVSWATTNCHGIWEYRCGFVQASTLIRFVSLATFAVIGSSESDNDSETVNGWQWSWQWRNDDAKQHGADEIFSSAPAPMPPTAAQYEAAAATSWHSNHPNSKLSASAKVPAKHPQTRNAVNPIQSSRACEVAAWSQSSHSLVSWANFSREAPNLNPGNKTHG